jgi:hypothetical protein
VLLCSGNVGGVVGNKDVGYNDNKEFVDDGNVNVDNANDGNAAVVDARDGAWIGDGVDSADDVGHHLLRLSMMTLLAWRLEPVSRLLMATM